MPNPDPEHYDLGVDESDVPTDEQWRAKGYDRCGCGEWLEPGRVTWCKHCGRSSDDSHFHPRTQRRHADAVRRQVARRVRPDARWRGPPDGNPMQAHVVATADEAKALVFPDAAAALECWRKAHGMRWDGRPNRPLTAFTVEIR